MVLHQKFGEWTLMQAEPVRRTSKNVFYLVQCSCGNYGEVSPTYLKNGKSTRCKECAQKRFKERFIEPPGKEFKYRGNASNNTWRAMIQRCTNPTNNRYYCYGARGIKVCERWLESFENFYKDMGERPKGMQLDRIDTNGPYNKENCRWVTPKQNSNNRNLRAPLFPGERFGYWVVIKLLEGYRTQHYLCKCDCGNEKIIKMTLLKSGATKQCQECRLTGRNHNGR